MIASLLISAVLAAAPASVLPRADVGLAEAYWQTAAPALTTACPVVTVTEGPMVAAVGNSGVVQPASTTIAYTQIGGCNIVLSWVAWRFVTSRDRVDRMLGCEMIAHEYGHVLGLPDSATVPMMNDNLSFDHDPVCKAVYGSR